MVVLSLLLIIPAFYGFLHVTTRWTFLCLALLGFFSFLGEAPCIAMAQETIPGRGGTMSGLIMGFAWGMGGLGVLGTGVLADMFDIEQAIGLLLYLPATALILVFFLPGKKFFPQWQQKPLNLAERTGNLILEKRRHGSLK